MKTLIIAVNCLLFAEFTLAQVSVKVDKSIQYQKIDGFGAMAENQPGWGNFKDFTPEFVNTVVDDLGCTIFRNAIDGTFETTNDNADSKSLNTGAFKMGGAPGGCDGGYHIPLSYQIKNLKLLKDKIESNGDKPIFFASVFSPPAWMKYNKCIFGVDGAWNRLATDEEEKLKKGTGGVDGIKDFKDEFAEFCYSYLKTLKDQGIEINGLSIQNEPLFPQSYSSCVYSPESYLATFTRVAQYLESKNFTPKMIFNEDIGDMGRFNTFVRPIVTDATASKFADIAAIHSYADNAITPGSADANTWNGLNQIARRGKVDRQFWQTEVSGFPDSHAGCIQMASSIFTALKYGKVNAWIFFAITRPVREAGSEHESLLLVNGQKSVRYHAAKHFFKYVRPGSIQVSTAQSNDDIMSIAFQNDKTKTLSIVLINASETKSQTFNISSVQATGFPSSFKKYITTSNANQKVSDEGMVNTGSNIILPASSIITLVGENSLSETPAAIDMATEISDIEVFPNPSSQGFNIKINNINHKGLQLELLNPQGLLVQKINMNAGDSEHFISAENLNAGVYFLRMENMFTKVIIQK